MSKLIRIARERWINIDWVERIELCYNIINEYDDEYYFVFYIEGRPYRSDPFYYESEALKWFEENIGPVGSPPHKRIPWQESEKGREQDGGNS